MTDAYAAYLYFNKLKDCTHVCCWSHVRRLFVSASRDYKDTLAQAFIDLIGILYKVEVENQVLGRTEKEIVKHRGEESLPVLHDLYQQATALLKQFEKNEIKLSAKLQQALTYMIDGLNIQPGGIYVDVTFGGGGHSREILSRLTEGAHLYSFDQDADAERNVVANENFTFVCSNFRFLKNWMRYYGVDGLDGLLADLGVSSHHFDDETRGFSFRFDSPLDMRMNKRAGKTAADIVNEYDEGALADIFYLYGELKNSRRIASALVKARTEKPILTTKDFMAAVEPVLGVNS